MAKTHGKTDPQQSVREIPAPGDTVAVPTDGNANVSSMERIALAIDLKTGKVPWDTMRPSTRARLRKALADDPRAAVELGIALPAGAGAAAVEDQKALLVLGTMLSKAVYGGLGSLLVLGVQRMGAPADAAEVMRFTPKQQEDWTEPTMAVVQQYLPAALASKHAAAIALALSVSFASMENYGKLQAIVADRRGAKTAAFTPRTDA